MLEKNRYDVVFLDHRMPDMDGIETLAAFRADGGPLNAGTPFIALTANAVLGARDEYMAAGFSDYMSKPVKQEKLNEILDMYIPEDLKQKPGSDGFVYSYYEDSAEESTKEQSKENGNALYNEELGVDEKDGLENCGSRELFLQTVKSYVETAGEMRDALTHALDEGDSRNYAIKVHGLKSTSRLVGAMKLSEMALELENIGNEGDIEKLREKSPLLIRLYDDVIEFMTGFYGLKEDDSQKPEISKTEFKELLRAMRDANLQFATDRVDEIVETLSNARVPEEYAGDWAKLKAAVFDIDRETIEKIISKIVLE